LPARLPAFLALFLPARLPVFLAVAFFAAICLASCELGAAN
jgi:hypothetical protein